MGMFGKDATNNFFLSAPYISETFSCADILHTG